MSEFHFPYPRTENISEIGIFSYKMSEWKDQISTNTALFVSMAYKLTERYSIEPSARSEIFVRKMYGHIRAILGKNAVWPHQSCFEYIFAETMRKIVGPADPDALRMLFDRRSELMAESFSSSYGYDASEAPRRSESHETYFSLLSYVY